LKVAVNTVGTTVQTVITVHHEETTVDTIWKRKLQLFGHTCLTDDILKCCNKDVSGVALLTADRVEWRRFMMAHQDDSGSWKQRRRKKKSKELITATM